MILRPMKEAPKDGTPIVFFHGDCSGVHIVAWAEFSDGYCDIEECDGAFYRIDDLDDFITTGIDSDDLWCSLPPDMEAKARKWFEIT